MDQYTSIYDTAVAIRDAILSNPLDRKKITKLASQSHVSRKKLLPVFKELTGTTIKRFHFEQVMKAASEMLLSGMTVKEVAIKCGYSHFQNNFTRGFREIYKAGPEEWLHNKLIESKKTALNHKEHIHDSKLS